MPIHYKHPASPFLHCKNASIGPVTTAALKRHGLKPHITPATHDIPGMVKAIADYFAK